MGSRGGVRPSTPATPLATVVSWEPGLRTGSAIGDLDRSRQPGLPSSVGVHSTLGSTVGVHGAHLAGRARVVRYCLRHGEAQRETVQPGSGREFLRSFAPGSPTERTLRPAPPLWTVQTGSASVTTSVVRVRHCGFQTAYGGPRWGEPTEDVPRPALHHGGRGRLANGWSSPDPNQPTRLFPSPAPKVGRVDCTRRLVPGKPAHGYGPGDR